MTGTHFSTRNFSIVVMKVTRQFYNGEARGGKYVKLLLLIIMKLNFRSKQKLLLMQTRGRNETINHSSCCGVTGDAFEG